MRAATVLAVILAVGAPLAAQEPACRDLPEYALLDFWIGTWDVFVGDRQVGTNRIEPVLGGCAVLEHWTDAGGGEGKSFFYYSPDRGAWLQVWVTATPGAIKEKAAVDGAPAGSVRFQGEVTTRGGTRVLDRTTLTPLDGGAVRQLIEVSSDGGANWRPTFDAVYRPRRRG